ncbi:MAG TPA: hypothetical protein VKM55_27415 [Candidatus Lokiarchaeia archaeon]|nr:hypothetical protein [Candidatus Lokiarchaeia archaeon]
MNPIETRCSPSQGTDLTNHVLAAIEQLKNNYEPNYVDIESGLKRNKEKPVRIFKMGDGIPIVLQLSAWDLKLGPITAMLVGDAELLSSISDDELASNTRMIDVITTGNPCDLSKDSTGRFLVKLSFTNPASQDGEEWLLLTAYYKLTLDGPRAAIGNLLVHTTASWHNDVTLSEELKIMQDAFDVTKSKWLLNIAELRISIWSLLLKYNKASPPRPNLDSTNPRSTEVYPASLHLKDEGLEARDTSRNATAISIGQEPAIADVLGRLQRGGCSVKINKEMLAATAFRLVELKPGKGGVIGLAYSFRTKLLAFPVIHVIDGACYAGNSKATLELNKPHSSDIFHDHLPRSEELLYRGKVFGRVYQNRAIKPVIVPIVLVQQAIKGTSGGMPFCWIEPEPSGTCGYYIVVASEIDQLDKFIMNVLQVLGPHMVEAEATHVDKVSHIIKQTNVTGWIAAALVILVGVIGALACLLLLPLDMSITILQNWYLIIIPLILGIIAEGYIYKRLDMSVDKAMAARAADVAPRTPFLATPRWEDIVPAARRIGKVDFRYFKDAFCQDLDNEAINEVIEVVFRYGASTDSAPSPVLLID